MLQRFFINKTLLLIIVLLLCERLQAQTPDTSIFNFPLQMDEVTVQASNSGFDVSAFISMVQHDTTFYKAFRSLRITPHILKNEIIILDKKGNTAASYFSTTRQLVSNGCRTMATENEKTTGNFYRRNGAFRYYTAEMYAHLFFTEGRICGETDIIGNSLHEREGGGLGKSKYQLKQLMFNPGSKVQGVPFMGDRAAIFQPEQRKKYNWKLLSVALNGEDCWLFQAIPKPEYRNDVVYNEFSTWFRKTDKAILARNYSLSFSTAVYDFDVRIKARMTQVNGKLLPLRLEYDGNWRAVTKGRERAKFTAVFQY